MHGGMPGAGGLAAEFAHVLLLQGLLVALIFALLGGGWIAVRAGAGWVGARVGGTGVSGGRGPEPAWHAVLRIGFGVMWIFDGILQAQPAMPAHFPGEVLQPAGASSPPWIRGLVDWASANWSHHPVPSAAATVWIQVGIGVLLLATPRLTRPAGLISAGWGLVVWIFGEALGGVANPGQSWLLGAPGAAAYYIVAGLLLAAPAWPALGRVACTCTCTGIFLLGMAVLQAWPGRGFWQGTAGGQPGPLADAANGMAQLPQPSWLSGLVDGFTGFDEAHGFAVNLVAVAALTVIGGLFVLGGTGLRGTGLRRTGLRRTGLLGAGLREAGFRGASFRGASFGGRQAARVGLVGLSVLGLANWVFVQDLGFLGGLGTDPNSMLPMILLASAAYLALIAEPAATAEPMRVAPAQTGLPIMIRRRLAGASFRSVVAAGAAAMVLLGVVPLALTQILTRPG